MQEANPQAGNWDASERREVESPVNAERHAGTVLVWRTALRWFAGGLFAAPFGILPHEIGHYLVLLALGVSDLTLHFAAVSWDLEEFWEAILREDYASAAVIAPVWGVALSDAAGPVATYAIVLACCCACAIRRPHPALVAVAYFAQIRIRIATMYVARRMFNSDLPSGLDSFGAGANFDELRVAILTGIPVQVLVGFALLFFAITGIWLARYLPRGRRSVAAVSMASGMIFSLVAYAGYVGPWLLP